MIFALSASSGRISCCVSSQRGWKMAGLSYQIITIDARSISGDFIFLSYDILSPGTDRLELRSMDALFAAGLHLGGDGAELILG